MTPRSGMPTVIRGGGLAFEDYVGSDHEAVMPSQFQPQRRLSPEAKLIAAVFESAIDELEKYQGTPLTPRADNHPESPRSIYRRAWIWIMEPDSGGPFSFAYACEVTGADPEAVRAVVRARFAPPPRER